MIGKRSIAIAFGVAAVLLLPLAGGEALAAPPKKQPAPTVTATTPSNGATGVALNVAPTATFDVNIAVAPAVTLANSAGVAVPFDVVVSRSMLTIVPRSPLATTTAYTASVKAANAIDGTQMSKPYKWTFTTGVVVRPVNNDCSAGTVEFTFDDGPTATTPSVISRLQALNLTGTFFVLGEEITGNAAGQQTIRDEYAAGFSVQNHTYDHKSFTGASTGTAPLTDAQIVQELDSASDAVVAAGVPKPTLYRPPYGDINAHADQVARNAGYRIVMPWSTATGNIIDSRDWTSGVTAADIVRNVTVGYTDASGQFFPGMKADSIIAMHDADAIGTPKTVEALQGIVDYMNANHFCSTSTTRPDATGGIVPPPPPPPPVYRPLNNDCSAGNVEFTFDDGPDVNTPAVLAALQGLGIKGVFFVLGTKIDTSAANAQTVRDEIAQGHTVGNHSYDHASFNGVSTGTAHLTDAQITDELEKTAASLTSLGLPKPTLYRPPYGDIDAYTDNLARSLGYRIVMPWALGANTGTRIVDSKDWSGISPEQIASNVVNGFTDANGFHPGINANSIIAMHDGETATTLNTIASLQLIVDYMNANHYCATSTIPDDATGAVVPLPAPPEPDASNNLVQNASLETVPVGSAEPSCFQQNTNGGNVGTWSLTSDAHSGAIAARVDETQWTSGDRKLITTQRGSQSSCIASLTEGQSVRAWVWYRGSWSGYGGPSDATKVSMAIYYRNSAGGFTYWMSSPLQPPSSGWNLASVKTPPLPAGATGVSFGLAIKGVGTLITDDYALAVQ